jgi:hypothetical protein
MLDSVPAILQSETLPFPFNNRPFCRYEPIEKRVEHAKVLIVNDLLRYEDDLSDLARATISPKMFCGSCKTRKP